MVVDASTEMDADVNISPAMADAYMQEAVPIFVESSALRTSSGCFRTRQGFNG